MRRLSNDELRAFGSLHCGMQPGDFERYTADEVVMDGEDFDTAPWPYSTKVEFLLHCWTPAGKAN